MKRVFILPTSSLVCARRQAAKALDCKSGNREFESHRALQFLTQPGQGSLASNLRTKEITK
jgi:hypothetical protein